MVQKEITFDKFIRWTGIILLIVFILYAVNYLSAVLIPFFVAWVFAYLLYPIVKFIENKLHVRIRALSIILTFIVVIAALSLLVYLLIPPMIEQFGKLYEILTRWLHQTTHTNNITAWISDRILENQETIQNFLKSRDFTDALKTAAPKLFNFVSQTASVVISIVASLITLLYTFFILLDYEYLTTNWIRIFPKKNRPFWRVLAKDVERELNNYIRGQGTVAFCMGVMFCVGFTIMDFPMAISLGIIIGILDLVPYLHTFALIPTAFLAMLKAADTGQSFWLIFGMAVGLFIVVQVISDMVVTPKIMGKAMGLNPAILLLSLSVWGALLGFIGLIVALPLTTLIIAYWKRYITKEDNAPIEDHAEPAVAVEAATAENTTTTEDASTVTAKKSSPAAGKDAVKSTESGAEEKSSEKSDK
ncbi:MAG: AI-2E family transporter [Prevotella sp.]|jgi:predicted PurR-regulated permease PerM|nr:AI-2E family transporter [Prevotella sp.]